jgi:hypothetical protein
MPALPGPGRSESAPFVPGPGPANAAAAPRPGDGDVQHDRYDRPSGGRPVVRDDDPADRLWRAAGQWMYDSAVAPGLAGLIRAALLDLGQWAVTEFPLAGLNEAVTRGRCGRTF